MEKRRLRDVGLMWVSAWPSGPLARLAVSPGWDTASWPCACGIFPVSCPCHPLLCPIFPVLVLGSICSWWSPNSVQSMAKRLGRQWVSVLRALQQRGPGPRSPSLRAAGGTRPGAGDWPPNPGEELQGLALCAGLACAVHGEQSRRSGRWCFHGRNLCDLQ